MIDNELVDGKLTNVETKASDKGGSIESHAETLERFSYEELKDDNR